MAANGEKQMAIDMATRYPDGDASPGGCESDATAPFSMHVV